MSNTRKAKPQGEVFEELIAKLPEFMENYYYSDLSNKSMCTKLAYARDMLEFIEYAIQYYSYFPEKTVSEVTADDFARITSSPIPL